VHYCPSHHRAWLASAHRELETRAILSHIAHNAKPVFGANPDDGGGGGGGGIAPLARPKAKRRLVPKARRAGNK